MIYTGNLQASQFFSAHKDMNLHVHNSKKKDTQPYISSVNEVHR